jgi:hypothetical protein
LEQGSLLQEFPDYYTTCNKLAFWFRTDEAVADLNKAVCFRNAQYEKCVQRAIALLQQEHKNMDQACSSATINFDCYRYRYVMDNTVRGPGTGSLSIMSHFSSYLVEGTFVSK